MKPLPLLLASALTLVGAACQRPPTGNPQPPDTTTDEVSPTLPGLSLTVREGVSVVRGEVTLEVDQLGAGDTPERVELRDGTGLLATLDAPPWRWTWDTRQTAEGTHALTARAVLGDTSAQSAPLSLTVDRTPPEVLSRSPADGDTNVAVGAPLQVTFSEPLHPGSITDDTVLLATGAGMPLAKTLSLSADGRTLTITPLVPLAPPVDVAAALTPGLTDVAGNPVAGTPTSWYWRLPAWLTLGTPLPRSEPLAMQVDSAGAVVLATFEYQDDVAEVRVWKLAGGAWTDLGVVLQPEMHDGWRPLRQYALAIDAEDRPVLAFGEFLPSSNTGTQIRVFVRQWTGTEWVQLGEPLGRDDSARTEELYGMSLSLASGAGSLCIAQGEEKYRVAPEVRVLCWKEGTWTQLGAPLAAGTPGQIVNVRPSLSVSPSGDVAVAFEHPGSDGVVNIGSAAWVWDDGLQAMRWQTLPDLSASPGATNAHFPVMVAAYSMYRMVVWSEEAGDGIPGSYRVHVWRGLFDTYNRMEGEPFSANSGGPGVLPPMLALRPHNHPLWLNPVVGVQHTEASGRSVFGVNSLGFAGWESVGPRQWVPDEGVQAQAPFMALDPAGEPVVAWYAVGSRGAQGLLVQRPNR